MQILTPRLRLRLYEPDDFAAYERFWADPQVTRYVGGKPFTREQSWIRFLRQFGMWRLMGFGFFAITDRGTGAYLGEAGFHELRRDLTPSLEGSLETGWALVSAAFGRGLATEAVTGIVGWATEHHPGRRLTCLIDVDNTASARVALKTGFTPFAETTYGGRPVVLSERMAD